MILATFKHEGPIAGHDDTHKTGILGRRWAVAAKADSLWLERQCLVASGWIAGVSYYGAGIELKPRAWRFGFASTYYSGEHRWLNLGPVWATWGW